MQTVYRRMAPGEESQVSSLILRTFHEFVALDFPPEGIHEFRSYVEPAALLGRSRKDHFLLVAAAGDEIIGAIEIRNDHHVSLFFIDRRWHRQGIGRELLHRALQICRCNRPDVATISVNSSLYAVPIYECLGFHTTGPQEVKNGICFVPMALTLPTSQGGRATGAAPGQKTIWRESLAGVTRAVPIVMGYIPIGLAFGILARKAGLSAANTLLMSLLVYAGSAQLIAVGLFSSGAPAISVVLTTLVVNLRHLLMSAAVSPYLGRWRRPELAAFACGLTDETFAVHSARFASHPPSKPEAFATNVTAQTAWVSGTGLGVALGGLIGDVRPLALDYALPAMFIALLVMQIKDRIQIGVALLAGAAAVGLLLVGLEQWHVITATVIGATIGVILEGWTKERSL